MDETQKNLCAEAKKFRDHLKIILQQNHNTRTRFCLEKAQELITQFLENGLSMENLTVKSNKTSRSGVTELWTQLEELKRQNEVLQIHSANNEDKNTKTESACQTECTGSDINKLKIEQDSLLAENKILNSKEKTLSLENDKLREDVTELQSCLRSSYDLSQALNAEKKILEDQISSQEAEIKEQQRKLTTNQEFTDRLNHEKKSVNEKLQSLEAQNNKTLNEKLQSQEAEISKLQRNLKSSHDLVETLNKEKKLFNEKYLNQENEINKLQRSLGVNRDMTESINKDKKSLEEKLRKQDVEFCKLQNSLSSSYELIDELNKAKRVREEHNKINPDSKSNNDLRDEIIALKCDLKKSNDLTEALSKEKISLENIIKGHSTEEKSKSESLREEILGLRRSLRASHELTEALTREKKTHAETLQGQVEEEQIKNDELNEEVEGLKRRLRASQELTETLTREKKTLDETLSSRIKDLEASNDKQRDELVGLKRSLHASYSLTEELTSEKKLLEETLQKQVEDKEKIQKNYDKAKSQSIRSSVANKNLENISDKFRPSVIANRYNKLENEEWMEAKESLEDNTELKEEMIARLLCDLLMNVYKASEHLLIQVKNTLGTVVANPGSATYAKTNIALNNDSSAHVFESFSDVIFDTLKQYSRNVDTSVIVQEALRMSDVKKELDRSVNIQTSQLKRFMTEGAQLCWQMVLHQPPLSLTASDKYYDENRHKLWWSCDRTCSFGVNHFIWPVLCRESNVLVKGCVFYYANILEVIKQQSSLLFMTHTKKNTSLLKTS